MPRRPSLARLARYLRGRLGLKFGLMLVLMPCLGALLVIDNWMDFRVMAVQIEQAYDQSLLEPAQALADAVSATPDGVFMEMPFAVNNMFAATSSRYKQLAVQALWQAPGGAEGLRQLLGDGSLPLPADPRAPSPVFYNAAHGGQAVRVAAITRELRVGDTDYRVVVQAAESMGAREQALDVVRRQAILRDAWQLAVAGLLVWLSVTWTLRPLRRLREHLRLRRGRPLEAPLDTASVPQEVRPLVEMINQYVTARQAAVEAQARFLADASHQLRMPLAILFAQARYAARETDPARLRETLQAIIDQLGHSRRLAEQLLSLAHATQAAPAVAVLAAPADLNAIARGVVLQYLAMAHEKNIDLGWQDARGDAADDGANEGQPGPVVAVRASDVEIHEVLANLVHNAIRCTPAGGHITVAVHAWQPGTAPAAAPGAALAGEDGRPRRWVRAEVADSGPGIAPGRREQVFARFQREPAPAGGPEQARGAGLGLSIARAYARRNGGDVQLHDATPGARDVAQAPGLRAVLWLPAA